MSLTLPAAYSAATKQGNIQENWLIQLGHFNGDAQGKGEGGWDAVLQADGNANLINHLGSELVTSGGNLAPNGNWTIRDLDGGSGGWSAANPPVFQDTEDSSMVNALAGDDIDDGESYTLTFTVGAASLNLTIGGGDLSGNSADETYVATTVYGAATHTVTFQASADATHLWLTASRSGSDNGTLDEISLKSSGFGSAETSIIVDDGTVFQEDDFIKIDSEIMKITSISTHTLTVLRGQMATTAAVHLNNTALYWNNFTAIAGASTTVDSVFYRGVVTRQPSIRTAINLVKSTAKVSNISISLVNMQYKGDDFSAELLSGTRTYLNKDVRVYIQLNGNSTLSNCLHVYTGRLHGIKHNDNSIRLSIKAYSPWDRVDYPDTYSAENILAPLSFGGFTGNSSSYPGIGTDDWRPVPFTNTDSNGSNFVIGTDAKTSLTPSAYVESMDGFVPYDSGTSSSATVSSVEVVRILPSGKHSYYQRPTADAETVTESMIAEANMAKCYNGVTTDGGTVTFAMNVTGSEEEHHKQRFTILETAENTTVTVVYRITTVSAVSQEAGTTEVSVSLETAEGNSSVSDHTAVTGSDQTVTKSVSSGISYIDLKVNFASDAADDTSGGAVTLVATIYQIYAKTDEESTKNGEIFIDADGTLKNYTSGDVANIHEAHRSLLHNALGLTDTPTNWSALNTERVGSPSAWTILYWQNDQKSLKRLLDELQYEGQFIYLYERAAGKYIFIADSPSSIATITQDDISSFSIDEVNFDELETKHVIDYDPHPAKSGEYRSQSTQTSSNRTDYNFATNENIINVTLKALAASVSGGSARNDDWATYRQKLFGAIKLTVRFNLINPAFTNIEVGDIIDFGAMPVDPGGGSWSGKNFIITRTRRSPGLLSITAREV